MHGHYLFEQTLDDTETGYEMHQHNPHEAPQGHVPQGWTPPPEGVPSEQPSQQRYGDESDSIAAEASPAARAKFIERTYMHLAGAISAFVVLLTIAVNIPGVENLVELMIGSRASWGVVLFLFVGASWVADRWARGDQPQNMQYLGLGLYVVAEVITFIPLVYIARALIGTEPILMAGGVTMAMFAAMTGYVLITKKDFSFMRGILAVLTMGAMALVIGSLVFGFSLGIAFSVGMIALASGYILYYTSNVLRVYRVNQHVAAALALFSAVALLFWYVLRLLMQLRR